MSKQVAGRGTYELPHWKKEVPEKRYSADDVLEAYETGYEKAVTDQQRIIDKKFGENLRQAQKISEDLGVSLSSKFGVNFDIIRLKVESITKFKSLVIIPEEDYFNEDVLDNIYEYAFEVMDSVNNDDFEIEFLFTYNDENLDQERIVSDGYFLYHEKGESREA